MYADNTLTFTELHRNDITILKAEGFIDASNAHKLEEKFNELFSKANYKLVVNMDGLSFVGSAGWGIFLSYLRRLDEKGGGLKLTSMKEDVESVFKIMEFFQLIESYATEQEAYTSFRAN